MESLTTLAHALALFDENPFQTDPLYQELCRMQNVKKFGAHVYIQVIKILQNNENYLFESIHYAQEHDRIQIVLHGKLDTGTSILSYYYGERQFPIYPSADKHFSLRPTGRFHFHDATYGLKLVTNDKVLNSSLLLYKLIRAGNPAMQRSQLPKEPELNVFSDFDPILLFRSLNVKHYAWLLHHLDDEVTDEVIELYPELFDKELIHHPICVSTLTQDVPLGQKQTKLFARLSALMVQLSFSASLFFEGAKRSQRGPCTHLRHTPPSA